MENEQNKVKLFWQNLNSRQKKVFVAGGIVIAILLVIGFAASVNMTKEMNDDKSGNETTSSDDTSDGEGSEAENGEEDDVVDTKNYATTTPIEGGDVNSIDTYLPHETTAEIAPELTEEGILDIEYSIQVDKDNKVITVYVYDMNDKKVRADAEAYLASIPAEVLSGYEIQTLPYYSDDEWTE